VTGGEENTDLERHQRSIPHVECGGERVDDQILVRAVQTMSGRMTAPRDEAVERFARSP
jgi:hypothetical protein